MTELRVCRRRFLQGMGVAAGSVLFGPLLRVREAAAAEQIVWAGWGGDYQKHQSMAFATPFAKETGVKVVEVSSPGNMVALIKAQVENKNPEWDIVELVDPEAYLLEKHGYLAEIKYDDEIKKDFPTGFLEKHVAGFGYFAFVLAWNTKSFPGDKHPKTWVDFWEVKKYPGPRTACGWFPYYMVEIALMADGVPKEQVYPLNDDKIRRAFEKLKQLRPHIVTWWNAGAQSAQLFTDGEVVLGMIYENRIREAQKKRAPVDWTLNQAIAEKSNFVIPAGSRNKEAASKFISIALRRQSQAHFVRLNQYGARNPKAYDLLTLSEKERNIGYPPNLATALLLDGRYWAETYPKYSEAWEQLKAGK